MLLHLACMLPIPNKYVGVWLGQAFSQYDVGIVALNLFKSMTITVLSPTTVELHDVCGRGCDRPVRPLRNEPKGGPGCYLYGAGHVTWLLGNRCTQYVGLILCI